MGLVFDKKIDRVYASWESSRQGKAISGAIEKLFAELIDPRQGEDVLDIGCGAGSHLLVLNEMGLGVSGIDASPYMIHKSEDRLGRRCTLRVGTAEDLPFEDNAFDLSVFVNSLEFMDDPLQALREAGRVARRKVFVGMINSLSWNGLIKRVQGYLGDPVFGQARLFNFWQMKSLLKAAYGPVPVEWGCIRVCPAFLKSMMPDGIDAWFQKRSAFGFFLGFSATLLYRVKTENLPLKIKLKKAGNSLAGARTFEVLKRTGEDQTDEKSLPV